jgi:iron complex transport system substrate-binding protein
MVSLSADKAPWVAGINTYISDVYKKTSAYNAFDGSVNVNLDWDKTIYGWKQANPEVIVEANPDIILIISQYSCSQENYDYVVSNLPEEWKYSNAYKNDKIYMVCDSAADLMQRPSTRLAQLTELVGRIFHETYFPDDIVIPHFFGNEYADYLVHSKTL